MAAILLVSPFSAHAESLELLEEDAIEAFSYNRLDEAAGMFETLLVADRTNARAYRYLGLCYEQLGRPDDANALYETAVDVVSDPGERAKLLFQYGAFLRRNERPEEAAERYSEAIAVDNELAGAYLNRANVLVALERYEQSVADYRLYLALDPATQQRPQIERMIGLLEEQIEADRLAAEEAARVAAEEEAARVAAEEEQRRREEEERRQAEARRAQVLSSVLDSLNQATDDSRSYEIENEDVTDYTEEIDIID